MSLRILEASFWDCRYGTLLDENNLYDGVLISLADKSHQQQTAVRLIS